MLVALLLFDELFVDELLQRLLAARWKKKCRHATGLKFFVWNRWVLSCSSCSVEKDANGDSFLCLLTWTGNLLVKRKFVNTRDVRCSSLPNNFCDIGFEGDKLEEERLRITLNLTVFCAVMKLLTCCDSGISRSGSCSCGGRRRSIYRYTHTHGQISLKADLRSCLSSTPYGLPMDGPHPTSG